MNGMVNQIGSGFQSMQMEGEFIYYALGARNPPSLKTITFDTASRYLRHARTNSSSDRNSSRIASHKCLSAAMIGGVFRIPDIARSAFIMAHLASSRRRRTCAGVEGVLSMLCAFLFGEQLPRK